MSELQEPPTKRLKPSDESGKVENRGSEDLRAVVSRDVRDASVNLERSADEPSVRFGDFIMSMAKHRIMSIQNGSNPVTAIEAAAVLKVNEGNEKDITTMHNNMLKSWRRKHGMHLLEVIVDQIIEFLVIAPEALLLQIANYTNVEAIRIYTSLFTTLGYIRNAYQISDPDWWPFLRLQDVHGTSDTAFMRKHNIALAVMMMLQPSIRLRDLHEVFLDTFVPHSEQLSVWHADLFYSLKLELIVGKFADGGVPSDMLFSLAFPKDSQNVLRSSPATDSSTDLPIREEYSTGDTLLIHKCAYVRAQYDKGVLNSLTADMLRGGQTWLHSLQRALPHIVKLLSKIREDPDWLREADDASDHVESNEVTIGQSIEDDNLMVNMQRRAAMIANALSQASQLPLTEATSPSAVTSAAPASTRRVWTQDEETALLAGLAQVGGPHWAQILALYGSKGTVSDVLKDRNQVQLKDKARNLKLWFLKNGQEVPEELKAVTGTLSKRGKRGKRMHSEGNDDVTGSPEEATPLPET